MPHFDDTYKLAKHLLMTVPCIPHNVVRVACQYEDEKIRIFGVLDREAKGIERISIFIKLPNEGMGYLPSADVGFGLLPKETRGASSWTQVYYWSEVPHYFRPGKWVTYMQTLVQELDNEAEKFHKLNNQPVDDSKLFQ